MVCTDFTAPAAWSAPATPIGEQDRLVKVCVTNSTPIWQRP